jgi:hypothetical protein
MPGGLTLRWPRLPQVWASCQARTTADGVPSGIAVRRPCSTPCCVMGRACFCRHCLKAASPPQSHRIGWPRGPHCATVWQAVAAARHANELHACIMKYQHFTHLGSLLPQYSHQGSGTSHCKCLTACLQLSGCLPSTSLGASHHAAVARQARQQMHQAHVVTHEWPWQDIGLYVHLATAARQWHTSCSRGSLPGDGSSWELQSSPQCRSSHAWH